MPSSTTCRSRHCIGGAGQGHFLVERYQVMVTPSASVWLALGARPPAHATAGVLAFAPQPADLPASRREVAAIARLGGTDTRVVSGSAATEAAFRREAPTRRVIHLATYGVLNKQNPLFSFVEFAPDGRDDGRLEVHEVFGLDLAADLVVLSACQTGLGSGALSDVPAGDDWVGLARAFLSAGAGNVIATLWPVQDRASAALMERFYQGYTVGSDPGRALASGAACAAGRAGDRQSVLLGRVRAGRGAVNLHASNSASPARTPTLCHCEGWHRRFCHCEGLQGPKQSPAATSGTRTRKCSGPGGPDGHQEKDPN